MPFVDRRIVEWGLMLPDDLKSDRNEGKKILKQWAASFMPTEHFAAKKRGFYVPVNDWWRGDRLASLGQILLSNESIRRWFNPKGVTLVLSHPATLRWCGATANEPVTVCTLASPLCRVDGDRVARAN